ncbi:MAG: hypothetical protein EHM35_02265 [Planctomycetaceae bacterium]|nr:MAG: hypothetical protein EHM35_02265 [Planctomycetaceae bacterium]
MTAIVESIYENARGLKATLEVAVGKLHEKQKRIGELEERITKVEEVSLKRIAKLEKVLRELLEQVEDLYGRRYMQMRDQSQGMQDAISEANWVLNSPPDPKPEYPPSPPPKPADEDQQEDDEI